VRVGVCVCECMCMYVCLNMCYSALHVCLCAALIEQQLCVMAVMFIRTERSGMITIWVARFGLGVTGHGLIWKASPALIMKPVMSDNNHLMKQGRGSCFLVHSHSTESLLFIPVRVWFSVFY